MAAEDDECVVVDGSNPAALRRQRSACACRPHWCSSSSSLSRSRRRTAGFAPAAAFGDGDSDGQLDDDPFASDRPPSMTAGARILRALWRRVLREKRRILSSANPPAASHAVPYDPYTYAQNFDEGSAAVEPDNLSRSFSARFAAPPSSRMMQRVG